MARDARFDGVFFVGVTTTRIYCRPICPAITPREDRCRFYSSAAAAERRGFRPCLRCRPELAPGGGDAHEPASVDAVAALARVAAARIAAGALDRQSVTELAASLGVSDRHLRRSVDRELGASPAELAQTRRLLTAKQLLTDTTLSMSAVAAAAGFRSVRRFNALFQQRYRLSPTALRRDVRIGAVAESDATHAMLSLWLSYRPPYDWEAMRSYLAMRATAGVEWVTEREYWRTVSIDGAIGAIRIGLASGTRRRSALHLSFTPSLLPVLVQLLTRLRRVLDLDCHPRIVAAYLGDDPLLSESVAARPGLRVPGAFDGTELAVRTVLGQQVSVRGANTLARRLVERLATPLPTTLRAQLPDALTHLAVTAEQIVSAGTDVIATIGMPRTRAAAIVSIARSSLEEIPELHDGWCTDPHTVMLRLRGLPGIGEWTAQYVAMRALRWPDAFPEGDLVLQKSAGGLSAARLRARAESWRPWRAYAAQHLWAMS
jgi:AraC family transcriptional regulator, regulatory protein of adaptative response / DNA-3-methyladenine glycosylase II